MKHLLMFESDAGHRVWIPFTSMLLVEESPLTPEERTEHRRLFGDGEPSATTFLVHYQRVTGPSMVRVHPRNADSFYMALYNASIVCCQ